MTADNQTTDGQPLGPAAVRWNDYVGTAAADDANALLGVPSLYSVAALDRDRWLIVGVDLGVSEGRPAVTVFAVDRAEAQIETLADLDDLGRGGAGIPVVPFPLSRSSDVEAFVNEAFQRIAIRLVAEPLQHYRLVPSSGAAVV